MSQVQLLIEDEGNRRALAKLLEERYAVEVDETLRDVGLHIVDDRTLPEYRDAILAHKRDQYPVFCPVVLIRREDTNIRIDLPDPDAIEGPQIINEIMTAPVERPILFRRLTNLLVRRTQTEKLIEKTERLDRFASMASHELRNPLNILRIYLSMARESGDPEDFDQCEQAIDRMNRQIEDFLTLARKGSAPAELELVDFERTVMDCWEIVEVPSADLRIDTERYVLADEDKLFEVLENLFRNAIEHGGSDVEITVGSFENGFYVEDDGHGIPTDDYETVFEDGFSTSQHGTGFGLTIIDRIVEAHGWDVRVAADSGNGARFEITGVEWIAEETHEQA